MSNTVTQTEPSRSLFTTQSLISLALPLIVEQLLSITVGMFDTMMVSNIGQTAVSGISLVDSVNVLLNNILNALGIGGSVIIAQLLGRKDMDNAEEASRQVMLLAGLASGAVAVIAILLNRPILGLLYPKIEAEVMRNGITYFYVTALSYPVWGVYNACAGVFRAMGNTKVSMTVSFGMNILNVALNALFIYGLHMGVLGAGLATLIARTAASVWLVIRLRSPQNPLSVRSYTLRLQGKYVKEILSIGLPTSFENLIFQLGKIMIATQVALLATSAIAANAVANSVSGIQTIPGAGIRIASLTVVGQCIGASRKDEAELNLRRLMRMAYVSHLILNIGVVLASGLIVSWYSLGEEAAAVARRLLLMNAVAACTVWPPSFILPHAFRGARDIKMPFIISVVSMWLCRVVGSILLGNILGFGIYGIWAAVILDWLFRAVFYTVRFLRGTWAKQQAVMGK